MAIDQRFSPSAATQTSSSHTAAKSQQWNKLMKRRRSRKSSERQNRDLKANSKDHGSRKALGSSEKKKKKQKLKSCFKRHPTRVSILNRRKSVSFHHEDTGIFVLGLHEFTNHEYDAYFLTMQELESTFEDAAKIVMNELNRPSSDKRRQQHSPTTRGLEKLMYSDHTKHVRRQAYDAILRGGIYYPNDTDIKKYEMISEEALSEALRLAQHDAEFVLRCNQISKQLSSKDVYRDSISVVQPKYKHDSKKVYKDSISMVPPRSFIRQSRDLRTGGSYSQKDGELPLSSIHVPNGMKPRLDDRLPPPPPIDSPVVETKKGSRSHKDSGSMEKSEVASGRGTPSSELPPPPFSSTSSDKKWSKRRPRRSSFPLKPKSPSATSLRPVQPAPKESTLSPTASPHSMGSCPATPKRRKPRVKSSPLSHGPTITTPVTSQQRLRGVSASPAPRNRSHRTMEDRRVGKTSASSPLRWRSSPATVQQKRSDLNSPTPSTRKSSERQATRPLSQRKSRTPRCSSAPPLRLDHLGRPKSSPVVQKKRFIAAPQSKRERRSSNRIPRGGLIVSVGGKTTYVSYDQMLGRQE